MDFVLVILFILMGIVIFVFKRFSHFIYFLAIVDIFLRIIGYLKVLLGIPELTAFFNKYIPASLPAIINTYSSGIFNTILLWMYLIAFIVFESYIIRTFFRKK